MDEAGKMQQDEYDGIVNLENQLRMAKLCGDVETLENMIDDSFFIIYPGGVIADKEKELSAYRRGALLLTSLANFEYNISLHENCAVAIYLSELSGTYCGDDISGLFRCMRVWTKSKDQWKISASTVSRVVNR